MNETLSNHCTCTYNRVASGFNRHSALAQLNECVCLLRVVLI